MGEKYTESVCLKSLSSPAVFSAIIPPRHYSKLVAKDIIEIALVGRGAQIHKLTNRFIDLKMYT